MSTALVQPRWQNEIRHMPAMSKQHAETPLWCQYMPKHRFGAAAVAYETCDGKHYVYPCTSRHRNGASHIGKVLQ